MRRPLDDVAAALDVSHREGHVHGAVAARNVFVTRGGRALLSDFGLGDAAASAATDRRAFADLVRECGGRVPSGEIPPTAREIVGLAFPRRGKPLVLAALAAVVVSAATALVVVVLTSGSGETAVPEVLPGAVALGSALSSADVESVDCTAQKPSGASAACTVAQTGLAGRAVSPPRAGVVRRWAVRGARGQVALEVLRPASRTFFMVARTPYSDVPDDGLHVLPANLPIRPGDVLGLAVTPGAAVGIRRDSPGARTARWFGPLIYEVRPPEQVSGTGFDYELLLRAEYVPGARWHVPGRLVGRTAAAAPPGRPAGRYVLRRGASPAALVVVRAGRGVAADLIVGGRRLVRLPVPGACPEGELTSIEFRRVRFGRQILLVRWQNPHSSVAHEYTVNERSLTLLS